MNLHNEIMNIQFDSNDVLTSKYGRDHHHTSYKIGHRDARHAAAELALDSERKEDLIQFLFDALCDRHGDDLVHELKIEYGYIQGENV